MSLSQEQKKYIQYNKKKDTKLIACPGSGKTRCIVERIKYLVKNNYYKKDEIFVIAFTVFTKDNFLERLKKYKCTKYIKKDNISTIDSLAKYVLQKELDKTSSCIDVLSLRLRNLLLDYSEKKVKKVPKISKMKCLFVDEAQDLNEIQFDIIKFISKKNKTIVHLVGDPNQCIYQFRRSDDKYLMTFNAKEFQLTKNYRSSENIVNFFQDLRPHKNLKIKSMKEAGKKVKIIYKNQKEIQDFLIKKIKKIQNSTIDLADVAIVCPTRGVKKIKEIGLSVIANLLNRNKIKFQQLYDETTDKNSGKKKYERREGFLNLVTYHNTKGLEWKIVIILEASNRLLNALPKNENDEKQSLYLLHVVASRAMEELYICGYSPTQLNPWFQKIKENNYTKIGNELKIAKFGKYEHKKQSITGITTLINELTEEQLLEIEDKLIKTEIIFEKSIFENYTELQLDNADDSALLGIFSEKLFCFYRYLLNNTQPQKIETIENLVNDKIIYLKKEDHTILSEFLKKNQHISWDLFDSHKKFISQMVVKLVEKNYDRYVDFNQNTVIRKNDKNVINNNLADIKRVYNKYKKCENWKDGISLLFYLCVVEYSIDTNHLYHINKKGKTKKNILKKFMPMFKNIYKYAKKVVSKEKNIIEKNLVKYNPTGINGEIDLIINNRITEIKCVKEITMKHYLQLLLYNFCHQEDIDKKYSHKFNVLNFLKGKKQRVNISIKKTKMFKLLNYLCDVGNLKFDNLNLVYDFETTGCIDEKVIYGGRKKIFPEPTDLAIIDYDSGMIIQNKKISIIGEVDPGAQEITGLTKDLLKYYPNLDRTRKKLHEKLKNVKNLKMIAHFGYGFDNKILDHYKLIPEHIKLSFYDSIILIPLHYSKMKKVKILHGKSNRKLQNLYYAIVGKELENAHSAKADVDAVIEIMKKLNVKL